MAVIGGNNMFYEDPYLEFVHQNALKLGRYFLLDSGEGREFVDPKNGWDVEDLSGWLIKPLDHKKFINARKMGTTDDEFKNEYVFAIWSKDDKGKLKITFRKY